MEKLQQYAAIQHTVSVNAKEQHQYEGKKKSEKSQRTYAAGCILSKS